MTFESSSVDSMLREVGVIPANTGAKFLVVCWLADEPQLYAAMKALGEHPVPYVILSHGAIDRIPQEHA
jgi:hypothetical protein